MTNSNLEKVDVKKSLSKSLEEVELIQKGKLPKQSYKEMIERIRNQTDEGK